MKIAEKIEKSKAQLMLEQPYLGRLLSSLTFAPNSEVDGFRLEGGRLYYAPDFFEESTLEEVTFILAHSAMQRVLKYRERHHGRYDYLWEKATAYIINEMLIENGFTPPAYGRYDSRFKGMYAEEVYAILYEQTPPERHEQEQQKYAQSMTLLQENSPSLDKEEVWQEEKIASEALFFHSRNQGELPEGLASLMPEMFESKIDWKKALQEAIDHYAKDSYRFLPPNKKYLYRGIYLPSLYSEKLLLTVAIDTSGSIDQNLLSQFLGELSAILQHYPSYTLRLICVDDTIRSDETYESGDELPHRFLGGGGTDFRVLFSYIDEVGEPPSLLLYFTDGEGTFPQDAPFYDVLWVMPHHKEVTFGNLLLLNEHS